MSASSRYLIRRSLLFHRRISPSCEIHKQACCAVLNRPYSHLQSDYPHRSKRKRYYQYITTDLSHRCVHISPSAISNSHSNWDHLDVYEGNNYLSLKQSDLFFRNSSPTTLSLPHVRGLHSSVQRYEPGDSDSKVEKAVKAIQSNKKAKQKDVQDVQFETPRVIAVLPKPSMVQRFKKEMLHYWNGSKLLWTDIQISFRLLRQVLKGHTLSRREYRQFTRTVSDLFRMVPFLVFIIIPFMEFLLPVALYMFPNMLPSHFETSKSKEARLKKELKGKLEIAKFLQDTIEESALHTKKPQMTERAKEFADFLEKIRSAGTQATNNDILQFSKLFEDELTLDNLTRGQLMALCRLLRLQPIGTNNFLRFQLRMQLRSLKADDKMIQKEGLDNLTVNELQAACQARGMRALGVPTERLRSQLQQWLDLHLDEQIPTSLLLLSRALYLPDHLSTADTLQATIAALPQSTGEEAKVKLAEMQGEKVDNKERLNLIKKEEEAIKQEKEESKKEEMELQEERIKKSQEMEEEQKRASEFIMDRQEDLLVDKAPSLEKPPVATDEGLSREDIKDLEEVITQIAQEKEELIQEKEDIEELKEDIEEYREDLEDLKKELQEDVNLPQFQESKASVRLSKQVNRLMGRLENIVHELEEEKVELKEQESTLVEMKEEIINGKHTPETEERKEELISQIAKKKKSIIRVEEIVNAMKKLDKVSDEAKFQRIFEALDEDHDGIIKIQEVLNVIETIAKEDVALNTRQISEVMDLLSKEEILEELERDIQEVERSVNADEVQKQ